MAAGHDHGPSLEGFGIGPDCIVVMLVAIHQPNFLPWLGWFDKLAKADIFILLDTVAHQRTGSNHTNRVQILTQGRPVWITVPIRHGTAERACIERLEIAENDVWRRKLRSTIQQSYAKLSSFAAGMAIVDRMLAADTHHLCELNLIGIDAMAKALGLSTARMIRSSTLAAAGASTELLISLVRAVGGDSYLAGHGAKEYQEDDKFAAAGIAVRYQDYAMPAYKQAGVSAFVPGLSAIDALMNCGTDAARLVGSGARR